MAVAGCGILHAATFLRTYVLTTDANETPAAPILAVADRRGLDFGAVDHYAQPGRATAGLALAPTDDAHAAGSAGPPPEPAAARAQRRGAAGRAVRPPRGRWAVCRPAPATRRRLAARAGLRHRALRQQPNLALSRQRPARR